MPKPAAAMGVTAAPKMMNGAPPLMNANHVASFSAQQTHTDLDEWLLDSGAAENLGPISLPLMKVAPSIMQLRVASGEILKSPNAGELIVNTPSADRPLHFHRVLTHAGMKSKLMSVYQVCESPLVKHVIFTRDGAQVITHDDEVLLSAVQENGCYAVKRCTYGAANTNDATNPSHSA